MPRRSKTTQYRHNLLQQERDDLYARFRGFRHTEPSALAGNLEPFSGDESSGVTAAINAL